MTFQNPKLACTAEPHCKTTIRSPVHHSFDLVITNLQSYTGWISMQYISNNKLAHMWYNGYQCHHIVHVHFDIQTILLCAREVQTTWKTHPCLNVNRSPKQPNRSPPNVQTAHKRGESDIWHELHILHVHLTNAVTNLGSISTIPTDQNTLIINRKLSAKTSETLAWQAHKKKRSLPAN